MDPGLWEIYESGADDDEVSVILRLAPGAEPPPTVRVVSQFGDIFTARMRRGDIVSTRQSPGVLSLKAGSIVTLPPPVDATDEGGDADVEGWAESDESSPTGASLLEVSEDGRGVVVGICDWGFDFTHPNFRNADGTTRLQCLWDQRGLGDPLAPAPYNQGRLLSRSAINAALTDLDPFTALGYHPASSDPTNTGSHGTHVADILAGNRREPGSEVGLASGSDIVFVHLASPQLGELENLGDSVGLLEGLDFIRRQAAGRPCVLHLSAGKTGGPHRGNTLLEFAVDAMLQEPGIVLVQSVGNYAHTAMHAHARVGPDQQHVLNWVTPANDRTPNELEIWYNGQDVFESALVAPDGREFSVALDNRMQLTDGTSVWGNFYHRLHEPNSGLNHIVVHLYTAAPSGQWKIVLRGRDVVDGRLHAWIERDATGRYQSRFPRSQASSRFTTNTICNSFRAIAVGAYDGTRRDRQPTVFSSRGPTADGRQKPELAAPGYRIRAARSTPRDGWRGEPRLCVKSGTSMAAPWVSGTVALMLSAAGRPLTIHEIRRALIGSTDPHPGPSGRTSTQLGYGYLNTAAAVAAARRIGGAEKDQRPPTVPTMKEGDAEETAWAPLWVDDAAAGANFDDEVAFEQQLEESESAGALEAAAEECSCSRREEAAQQESAGEQQNGSEDSDFEDSDDEGESTGTFEADDEQIAAPFDWEDVQEALDAFDESEA